MLLKIQKKTRANIINKLNSLLLTQRRREASIRSSISQSNLSLSPPRLSPFSYQILTLVFTTTFFRFSAFARKIISMKTGSIEQPDDWGDGSWIVDCVCGVNFDDGEEMVNCDECGVWVHTRCSRFVKTDASFSCQKCKINKNETEVARLLVELPLKTLTLDKTGDPSSRAIRLWNEIPMEEKVHVHGKPGGEPALFHGTSSIFTAAIWGATGYVPKKLNLHYTEFPAWDEKPSDDIENTANGGADALFSMSKDSVSFSPVEMLVGLKASFGAETSEKKAFFKQKKVREDMDSGPPIFVNDANKERTQVRSVGSTSKQRKENLGIFKDHNGKKKSRRPDNDTDYKRRVLSPTVELASQENGWKKATGANSNDQENRDRSKLEASEALSNDDFSREASARVTQNEAMLDLEQLDINTPEKNEISLDSRAVSVTDDVGESSVQKEVNMVVDASSQHNVEDGNYISSGVATKLQKSNPPTEGHKISAPVEEANQMHYRNDGTSPRSRIPIPGVKTKGKGNYPKGDSKLVSSPTSNAMRVNAHSKTSPSEKLPVHGTPVCNSSSTDQKAHVINRESDATMSCDKDDIPQETMFTSVEPSVGKKLKETNLEPKRGVKHFEDSSQIDLAKSSSTDAPDNSSSLRCKVLREPVSPRTVRSINQLEPALSVLPEVNCSLDISKVNGTANDTTRDEQLRKETREHSRVSANSISRTSLTRKTSHFSSAVTSSELKEHLLHSSNKVAVEEHIVSALPCPSQKVDTLNQLNSKVNHPVSFMHPPAATTSNTPLSDEELAFLLHQELNSSPRVPRVPRARQATIVPQLSSPTASGVHTKRIFSSGGKDQLSVSRMKNKEDLPKNGFRNSRERNEESRHIGRFAASLPDGRTQPSPFVSGSSTRKESRAGGSHNRNHHVHRASRNISDDDHDEDEDCGPRPLTLPGLLNEIMSKGERMTYEELCNRVQPHWESLRKQNGERYAYQTHSQAVLDTLRNRGEWAQLVDRGPKTCRKRRKLDSDPAPAESEENKYSISRRSKGDVHRLQREDFPKGKRMARKRKDLSLESTKGEKINTMTSSVSSPSSESTETNSSADDSHSGSSNKASSLASQASTSSGDTQSMTS